MTKPRTPIDTGAKITAAREHLGLSKAALARVLRLGHNGRDVVRRAEEAEERDGRANGPLQVAVEALLAGFRPRGSEKEFGNVED